MIELSALMWTFAIFFGILGFLRGWNKEVVATAGIVMAVFAIFQIDGFVRGYIFVRMPPSQVFLLQGAVFCAMVFFLYRAKDIGGTQRRDEKDWQAGILGAAIGFFNGYLIGGSLWYFLDINEYPLTQFVVAPSPTGPSAQSLGWIPIVLVGGGASGTGDLLAVIVLVLLFVVFIML